MRKESRTIAALTCLLGLMLLPATLGCEIELGETSRAHYERSVALTTSMTPGSTVDVDTKAGSVTVVGADVADCNVVATITGHAPTEDEARQYAEETEIELDWTGETLKVRADKPDLPRNRSVAVSYTVTVPHQTHVVCHSSYGSVSAAHLHGTVTGKTSSGSITLE